MKMMEKSKKLIQLLPFSQKMWKFFLKDAIITGIRYKPSCLGRVGLYLT